MLNCYKEGYSDEEICKELEITPRQFKRRLGEDDIFSQLVELGRMFSKAWWMSQGRLAMRDRNFNMSLWYANMKNRFGWSDKVETTTLDDKPIEQKSEQELINEILTKHKSTLAKMMNGKDTPLSELLHGSRTDH